MMELFDGLLEEVKKEINEKKVSSNVMGRLFDFNDKNYNRPLKSEEILTPQTPEALAEKYIMLLLTGIGIKENVIVKQPLETADMGVKISKQPDLKIEKKHTRGKKGLLFEIEPLRKNLLTNLDHGVNQAKSWFKIRGLDQDYEAIATNLVDWYWILPNEKGYGMRHIKMETPYKALERIYGYYFGLDSYANIEYEENIEKFYKDYQQLLEEIVLEAKKDRAYQIFDMEEGTESEQIFYFRTIFFRLLFVKILHAWKIIKCDPITEYVFNANESDYYGRLERLFFKVFNTETSLRSIEVQALKSIPYLNGGLFRPNEIEKKYPKIHFSGACISLIWDTLNKYKYMPVAQSSENGKKYITSKALGHIFEKSIDSTGGDRKGTGTYYTPKIITDYITTETLKEYVIGKLNEKIRAHIKDADTNQTAAIVKDEITDFNFPINLRTEATNEISKWCLKILQDIRICDNACGSGAFLDSVAEKLEKLYRSIYQNLGYKDLEYYDSSHQRLNIPEEGIFPDIYSLRKFIISRNVYGVDIQKEGIQIAKLRLWLWLINPYDSFSDRILKIHVEPLPNIDYKIRQGNSLIGFGNLDQIRQTLKKYGKKKLGNLLKFVEEGHFDQLHEIVKMKEKFTESIHNKKTIEMEKKIETNFAQITEELDEIYADYILEEIAVTILCKNFKEVKAAYQLFSITKFNITFETKISDKGMSRFFSSLRGDVRKNGKEGNISCWTQNQKGALLENIQKIYTKVGEKNIKEIRLERNILPSDLRELSTFHWAFEFYEVFETGGFDIIVGNPPYIKEYTNKDAFYLLDNSPYYKGKMDLWYMFTSISVDLLKNTGYLGYIAQNNWTTSYGASKMRKHLILNTKLKTLVDFVDYPVFSKDIGIQSMIFILTKVKPEPMYQILFKRLNNKKISKERLNQFLRAEFETNDYEIFKSLIRTTDYEGKSITFNEACIEEILLCMKEKSNFSIKKDEKTNGIQVQQEIVIKSHLEKLGSKYEVGQGIFVLDEEELNALNLRSDEKKLIKDFYYPGCFSRFTFDLSERKHLIYTRSDINENIDGYPNIKVHLEKFVSINTSDNKPFGLHRSRDEKFFIGEKILSLRKSTKPTFTYISTPTYVNQAYYIIKTSRIDLKYLTSLLNSKTIEFWLKKRGKMQGSNFQIDAGPLLQIPIIKHDKYSILSHICEYLIFEENEMCEKYLNYLVYELYFCKERILHKIIEKYIQPIEFEKWAKLNSKQQISAISKTEQTQLNNLTNTNKDVITKFIENVETDQSIQNQFKTMDSHSWIEKIEDEM